MKVLDVGCGVGGPARNIARFSGAHVTGLNNNDFQVRWRRGGGEGRGLLLQRCAARHRPTHPPTPFWLRQVGRATIKAHKEGLDSLCRFMKGDFMAIPAPDASFDAAFAIEATCHAPDRVGVFSEVFRVLKPGAVFGS
jgi:sterol 24-C-methyltransferase